MSARDKLTDEEIVLRRIEVFKAALWEVGFDPGYVRPCDGKGQHLTWDRTSAGDLLEYRAGRLAMLSVGSQAPSTCFACWSTYGSYEYGECAGFTPAEALQFRSCRTAKARDAASHG